MGLFDKLRRRKKQNAESIAAAPQRTDHSQTIVGFVLLERDDCDFELFISNMEREWDIHINERAEEGNLFFEVDGMQVVCAHIAAPVPNREVEENAKLNILWPEAEQVTSKHQSQIIISVLNATDAMKGYALFTRTASALLQLDHALAIYMAPLVVEAGQYVELSRGLKDDEWPVLLWVFIGLYQSETGTSAYTYGLRNFGKDEIEIIGSSKPLSDVYEMMFMTVTYVVDNDITLHDGETLGFTEQQKLSITRSKGIATEGDSLKIGL
ncbi:DUF4261 domain-containing protein [Paenibacillus barcinonensis]|uniref:DUF4261 domain-containing protein n=1 Tax=Paenibacillus barcinonensis TaxID=198119 RepID=A0A2V4UQ72_PAEBA|nr:DUF4261 domain-containing protein [Paenibacillus barcinonensis]PYE42387.1 uncharacterized protein DUF4261 [Paenibacillus barcinonensis]QKS58087.1 DUF4261 domain-containing protein [Paenibacillus barcinonensis]